MKKRKKKNNVDYSKILKYICLIIGAILILTYCIKGGFYSLFFDLKESQSVIVYGISIIVLLSLLIIFNISDEPKNKSEKEKNISSYITVGIIVLILIILILLIFTLLDFFLPIIVIAIILTLIYFLGDKLIFIIENKNK